MASHTDTERPGFFQRYRWLFWNPVWVLIAVAWLVLVVWALRLRFGGDDSVVPPAVEQTGTEPAR